MRQARGGRFWKAGGTSRVRATDGHPGKYALQCLSAPTCMPRQAWWRCSQPRTSRVKQLRPARPFAAKTYGGSPEDVCFAHDTVTINGNSVAFADLVQEAQNARVQLWSDGYYATPQIHSH